MTGPMARTLKRRPVKELEGIKRSTAALLWCLAMLWTSQSRGATYRGLSTLLGTVHHRALRRAVVDAGTLVTVSYADGDGSAVVALSEAGKRTILRAIGVK